MTPHLTHPARAVPKAKNRGFTLLEVMVAVTTLLIILGFLGSLLNSVYREWDKARRQTEVAQNARAILGLIEKDLQPATVSDFMQFGQNPNIAPKLANESQVNDSDSIFFWAPVSSSGGVNLSQVGWYLSKPTAGGEPLTLKRFYRPANTHEEFAAAWRNDERLYWLDGSPSAPADISANTRVVSDRVLGFWVECLDRAGNKIPSLAIYDTAANPLRYNSAARFQMARTGGQLSIGKSFFYTAPTTQQANLLPSAVRVTLLITDEGSLLRSSSNIPALPIIPQGAANVPAPSVDTIVMDYRNELARNGIQASVFTTVIKLSASRNL